MPAPGKQFAFSDLSTVVRRGDCPHIPNKETEVWTAFEACQDSTCSRVEGHPIPGLGFPPCQSCVFSCPGSCDRVNRLLSLARAYLSFLLPSTSQQLGEELNSTLLVSGCTALGSGLWTQGTLDEGY